MTLSASSAALDFATPLVESVNAALARYLEQQGDCPPHLSQAIRYSLLSPGERLRPMLVLLASKACGCD